MGTVVASDIFQKELDSVYIGLPGVTGIADDMIIFGKSETTRKNGLVLNKSKLQFKKQEVHFFGHRWNSHGIDYYWTIDILLSQAAYLAKQRYFSAENFILS